jgi:hypothetical protein
MRRLSFDRINGISEGINRIGWGAVVFLPEFSFICVHIIVFSL